MNKFLSLALVTGVLISCDQNKTASNANNNTVAATSFDANYQPATFADAGRMEKIMQAFPIIDKTFTHAGNAK